MILIFDVVVLVYGVYTIYSAINMKKTQNISNWLVGTETAASIRDAKGYIDFIYPKIIILGAIAVIFGGVSLVNDYIMPIKLVMQVMVAAFLAVCAWFSVTVRKARERFW
ncbi:MAG: hypothetical protein HFH38_08100 [Lachnospiraceae bacterium]|jgi:hypothetical protein|nr:hypothetical protein [Lachnospiraceae bacterium]